MVPCAAVVAAPFITPLSSRPALVVAASNRFGSIPATAEPHFFRNVLIGSTLRVRFNLSGFLDVFTASRTSLKHSRAYRECGIVLENTQTQVFKGFDRINPTFTIHL